MIFYRNEPDKNVMTFAELISESENKLLSIEFLDGELRYQHRHRQPQDVNYKR
jgi:hypothetical protein